MTVLSVAIKQQMADEQRERARERVIEEVVSRTLAKVDETLFLALRAKSFLRTKKAVMWIFVGFLLKSKLCIGL